MQRIGIFRAVLNEGDEYPRGYGMAYRVWSMNKSIAMPIPLNIIAGWWVRVVYELRHFWSDPSEREKRELQAFVNGSSEGYQRGYAAAKKEFDDQIRAAVRYYGSK